MADAEVSVRLRAEGFDQFAAQIRRAEEQLRNLGRASKAATGGAATAQQQAVAQQLSQMMGRVNGVDMGRKLGQQMQQGLASTITNGGWWKSQLNGLSSHFRLAGQQVGKHMTDGINKSFDVWRKGNGGKPFTHTDLLGGAVVGGFAFRGLSEVIKSASDREQARLNLRATGLLDDKQMVTMEKVADRWSRKFGNLPATEGLRFLRDATQIFGGTEHLFTDHGKGSDLTAEAQVAMDRIAGLMAFSKTYHGGEGAGHTADIARQFADAIRSGEIKGLGSNPIDLANWVEKLTKVALATGVDPTTFLQAQRAAGLSFLTLDDNAIYGFATNVQENRQRAGVQLKTTFMHMVAGNSQTVRGNEALRSLGLLPDDPKELERLKRQKKVELNSKGQISRVNDMSLLEGYLDGAKNPFKWDAEILYPAIQEKIRKKTGVDIGDVNLQPSQRTLDDIVAIMKEVGGAFKNSNEATMVAESIIQWTQMRKRGENVRNSVVDEEGRSNSVLRQMQAFTGQMDDLKVNLGESILPAVNSYLKSFNASITGTAKMVKANPWISKGLFGLGGLAIAGGGLAAFGLIAHYAKIPLLLLRSLGTLGWGITKALAGGGFAALFNMTAAGASASMIARMSQTTLAVSRWGRIMRALGTLFRTIKLLIGGPLGAILGGGYFVSQTNTGSAVLKAWGDRIRYGWNKLRGKDTKDDEVRMNESWRIANEKIKALAGLDPKSHRDRWEGYARNQNWLRNIRPPEPRSSWVPSGFGGRGQAAQQGGPKGPVPVVVTSMPKKDDRPNQITTHVTVNVTTNAPAPAIGGAVGAAVGSAVQGALHDNH